MTIIAENAAPADPVKEALAAFLEAVARSESPCEIRDLHRMLVEGAVFGSPGGAAVPGEVAKRVLRESAFHSEEEKEALCARVDAAGPPAA